MKKRLLDMLVCPVCQGSLDCRTFEASALEIESGVLLCGACRIWYPIDRGVPVLLVFPTPLHDRFAAAHGEAIAAFGTYSAPAGKPEQGEESVQQTFTEEWDGVQQDQTLSFKYTSDDLRELNRRVWLKWLPRHQSEVRRVLNVGVGLGQETQILGEVLAAEDLVAVDLNFAIIARAKELAAVPSLHVVIASLFHLPFRDAAFDLVYSQGVIHHTRSTEAAFRAIAAKVRRDGFCFVWVYGLDDHLVVRGVTGFVARTGRTLEEVIRPIVSRLPSFLRNLFFKLATALLHPLVLMRVRHRKQWKFANSEHSLRDSMSHRYAHRQSFNEVLEWFGESGFTIIDVQSPEAYRRLFGKRLWGVGMTGQRTETV